MLNAYCHGTNILILIFKTPRLSQWYFFLSTLLHTYVRILRTKISYEKHVKFEPEDGN